ncbi:uncharacterized protein [Haliotis cracherodii]|uniref:uncharacterized protein n=1 Tax=Haliotis cracherodii TaxID=6455 RepID=UPI0039EB4FFC
MGMAGNPRLQTSINIGSSPDVRPEIRKTVSMNAPRSQNLRQPKPVNRHTSHLPPSSLASGSRNSLRSSAARSATITRSDPFVHPGTSSLSRSTIAGSTASRAIAAGNVVVNGPAPGIRRVAGNSGISRNNGLHLNTGASSSGPGRFGTGSRAASGIQDLGLNAGEYSSAAAGRYPVDSGSRGNLGPSTGNHGAALFDVQGTTQSRSGVRGTLKGLRGASQVPLSGLLSGFDFGQFPSVTNPQGNSALGVSQTAPATSNVPSSSPMQNGGSELAGALKPSAFPLPTSYDVSATKPGTCLKPCGFSLCLNECNHDSQCPGSKKCCSSGCGQVCSEPYPYIPTIKPGVCPASRSSAVCTRRHSCSHDGECPGSSKCCCVGSGCRVCVQQVISLPKMATVPFLPQRTLSQFPMIGKGYVWR